jgi:hypothetical protein
MIKVINSKDLKTNTDMVCAHCGKDHGVRSLNGQCIEKEGVDYVFETDGTDAWCICIECQKQCDGVGVLSEQDLLKTGKISLPRYLEIQ